MRKPIVAGQFYPEDKNMLKEEVNSYIKKKQDKSIKAAIVPHAGYVFSGKCAGKVYSLLPAAETYVILGVNHHSLGKDISVSLDSFETPLGIVGNDVKLGKEILNLLYLRDGENAHEFEHSVEVQLPFLQLTQENFKILPIVLKNPDLELCKKLAKIIIDSANMLKRKIIVIASSDFTHTGPAYNFKGDIEIDKKAIDKILDFDSKGFLEMAEKTTICGVGAIVVTIEAAKLLGAEKGKLLEYYTSADIVPNESKVGYASIAFLA